MAPDLSCVLAGAWDELRRGADDRHHGFHVPTLCTVGQDGAPIARSVVLRRVLVDASEILCHTDVRSAKVAEIAREPRVCWHFYAPEHKLQLRVSALAEFHRDDARADEGWARSSLSSRRCYLAPRAPGAVCDGPSPNLPAGILDRRPTDQEAAPGRANFGVVVTRAYAIDWLFLASEGHQRARFERTDDPCGCSWSGRWVEP
jgi:pyridoxamine 5'-phosphate oxidase